VTPLIANPYLSSLALRFAIIAGVAVAVAVIIGMVLLAWGRPDGASQNDRQANDDSSRGEPPDPFGRSNRDQGTDAGE
jgi:hypothetical protein